MIFKNLYEIIWKSSLQNPVKNPETLKMFHLLSHIFNWLRLNFKSFGITSLSFRKYDYFSKFSLQTFKSFFAIVACAFVARVISFGYICFFLILILFNNDFITVIPINFYLFVLQFKLTIIIFLMFSFLKFVLLCRLLSFLITIHLQSVFIYTQYLYMSQLIIIFLELI